MTRFWVSWWTGYYEDEGCTKPPVQVWSSGFRDRDGSYDKSDISLCAVVDAENEDAVWGNIRQYFPDCEPRFCDRVDADWTPNTRSLEFRNETQFIAPVAGREGN